MRRALEEILASKKKEALGLASQGELDHWREKAVSTNCAKSEFVSTLRKNSPCSVIAEIKFASPSKGKIRDFTPPQAIAQSYANGGAACISVLTDKDFFGGSKDYPRVIKAAGCNTPILRKDFLIDEIQIYESKCLGCDALLLIVAALEYSELLHLAKTSISIGLDILVEVHEEKELEMFLKLIDDAGQILENKIALGINNRNLNSFLTDISVSERLLKVLKDRGMAELFPIISESGISSGTEMKRLIDLGASGFLIGESLMRAEDPGKELARLIAEASHS